MQEAVENGGVNADLDFVIENDEMNNLTKQPPDACSSSTFPPPPPGREAGAPPHWGQCPHHRAGREHQRVRTQSLAVRVCVVKEEK